MPIIMCCALQAWLAPGDAQRLRTSLYCGSCMAGSAGKEEGSRGTAAGLAAWAAGAACAAAGAAAAGAASACKVLGSGLWPQPCRRASQLAAAWAWPAAGGGCACACTAAGAGGHASRLAAASAGSKAAAMPCCCLSGPASLGSSSTLHAAVRCDWHAGSIRRQGRCQGEHAQQARERLETACDARHLECCDRGAAAAGRVWRCLHVAGAAPGAGLAPACVQADQCLMAGIVDQGGRAGALDGGRRKMFNKFSMPLSEDHLAADRPAFKLWHGLLNALGIPGCSCRHEMYDRFH
jgi:hypothetical protein